MRNIEGIEFTTSIKIGELQKVNDMVSRVEIWVGTDGENVKKYNITKQAYLEAMPTLRGTRIRGSYIPEANDFGGHAKNLVPTKYGLVKTPEPITYGFVDPYIDPVIKTVKEGGVDKDYIVCYGYVWTGIFPELSKLDCKSLGQSMEIKILDSEKDRDCLKVNRFKYGGLCMLGDGVRATFPMARIHKFSLDEEEIDFTELNQEDFVVKFSEVMTAMDNFIKQYTTQEEGSKDEKGVGNSMDKIMLRNFAMKMQEYGMGRYMPYAYDDKMMYAYDVNEEKSMAIPYMMDDEGMMTMDMDKMAYDMEDMAYDGKMYEDMMRALNTVMYMMKEKHEQMTVFSDTVATLEAEKVELTETVTSKDAEFSLLGEKVTSLEADVEAKDTQNAELTSQLTVFTAEKLKTDCFGCLETNQGLLTEDEYANFSTTIETGVEKFEDFENQVIRAVHAHVMAKDFSQKDDGGEGENVNFSNPGKPTIIYSDAKPKSIWDAAEQKVKV